DIDLLLGLEGVRHAPLEAGIHRLAVATEGHDHALLAFLNDEEAAAEPDQHDDARDQTDTDAGPLEVTWLPRTALVGARAAATAEEVAQLAIEVAPELVEVRWPVVAAVAEHKARSCAQRACKRAKCHPNGRKPRRGCRGLMRTGVQGVFHVGLS